MIELPEGTTLADYDGDDRRRSTRPSTHAFVGDDYSATFSTRWTATPQVEDDDDGDR